jgi:hypothetical protein
VFKLSHSTLLTGAFADSEDLSKLIGLLVTGTPNAVAFAANGDWPYNAAVNSNSPTLIMQ